MTNADTDPNRHLTAAELTELLKDPLVTYGKRLGAPLKLIGFAQQKTGQDSTTKVKVLTQSGKPIAVVSCSRPASPDLVIRGVERAEAVRKLVGPELGTVIIQPVASGYADGRSYAILPWCTDLSPNRYLRFVQRTLLKQRLLQWLRAAVASSATSHGLREENKIAFAERLRHMAQVSGIPDTARSAIRTALNRLDSDAWQPRHVFDHNDLWDGNVMLPGQRVWPSRGPHAFVLIDWVGAEAKGYGITDLIRLSRFLKLSPRELRNEVEAHCSGMRCDLEDAPGHLLAASGNLHQNLECFPEERFLSMFNACWKNLTEALAH